jgi:protoporphyrinogen oxidase
MATENKNNKKHIVIIGAGFSGLSAGYSLLKKGYQVTILEKDAQVGGLAQCFDLADTKLECFYHHWFTNDRFIMELVAELGVSDKVLIRSSKTGMYYANQQYRLSSPLDVLKFKPLSWLNRCRLGLMVLIAQKCYKDWKALDNITAAEWLSKIGGKEVFKTIWEPLLIGKFGKYAHEVSAAWFWGKLLLRGGSRGKQGKEMLAYYQGGFASLAEALVSKIEALGGVVLCNNAVKSFSVENKAVQGVLTENGMIDCDGVIATPALPIISEWLKDHVDIAYTHQLKQVKYLANVCLILQLNKSLSEYYWMNVNDPTFPFVGIIEHTNFEPSETYENSHIVYLSKYLPIEEEMYNMDAETLLTFALPYIEKMFPDFNRESILSAHVWRAPFAQPLVTKGYKDIIPEAHTPLKNVYISTMAQIYPEDRGTNYALREGQKIAALVSHEIK